MLGGYMMMQKDKLNIAIANDDAEDRQFFKEAFKQVKVATTVTTFKSGRALCNYLRLTPDLPHLVLINLNKPSGAGMEWLGKIRANKKLRDVVVGVYSSSSYMLHVEEAFIAGANIYIKKPDDYNAFKKVLTDVVGLSLLYLTDGLNRESFMVSYLEDGL